jgi:hypothetical protein
MSDDAPAGLEVTVDEGRWRYICKHVLTLPFSSCKVYDPEGEEMTQLDIDAMVNICPSRCLVEALH